VRLRRGSGTPKGYHYILILSFTFMLSLSLLLAYCWWPTASRAPVALAHAYVIGSDPVDGSTISSMPSVARIFFNEAISPTSIAHVFAPDGRLVDATSSYIPRNNPRELDTPLASPGSLPEGGYIVRWTALSNEDGHTTHGVIGFNLGESSVGLPGETILGPSTSNILPQLDLFGVLSVAWDWLVMVALTFWIGILVIEGLVLSRPAPRQEPAQETGNSSSTLEQSPTLLTQARRQSLPVQWLALTVLLVGEIITLILRATLLTQTLGGSGISLLALRQVVLETNYGYLWLVRFALILVALGLLWWTTRPQKSAHITSTKRSNQRIGQLRQQIHQQATQEENSTEDLASTDQEPENHAPNDLSPDEQAPDDLGDGLLAPEETKDTPAATSQPDAEATNLTSELASTSVAPAKTLDLAPSKLATSHDTPKNGAKEMSARGTGMVDVLGGDARSTDLKEVGARSANAREKVTRILPLVLAGLILLTIALTSDAAQLAQPHISAVVLDWLYLAAQSMWFGSLAYLGYILLPLLLIIEPHQHAGTIASMLRRLTAPALVIFAALLISGLYLSESSLSSAQQLFTDPYGRALLVKIGLLVLMLILSGYTLFVIRPKLARQAALLPVVNVELPTRRNRQSALEQTAYRLGRALKLQSWVGAAVLLCAALMTFFAPPIVFPPNSYAVSTSETAPSTTTAINAQTKQVGNLMVTLEVLPGRVDYDNTIIVTIIDNQGNPVTDAQVQLSTNMEIMDMGTAHATVKGGSPTYIATFNKDAAFSMPGEWDITLRITRPNEAPMQTVFKVMLGE
jgi:putative copper export protein/methionine-rich copper-binding protein CopC